MCRFNLLLAESVGTAQISRLRVASATVTITPFLLVTFLLASPRPLVARLSSLVTGSPPRPRLPRSAAGQVQEEAGEEEEIGDGAASPGRDPSLQEYEGEEIE